MSIKSAIGQIATSYLVVSTVDAQPEKSGEGIFGEGKIENTIGVHVAGEIPFVIVLMHCY